VVFKWRDQLVLTAYRQNSLAATLVEETRAVESAEPTAMVSIHKNERSVWVASPEDASDGKDQEKLRTPLSPHNLEAQQQTSRSQSHASELPTSAQANQAALNYCKTAALFFIALLVTWVPSTVNRLNSVINPDGPVYAMDFASALVLPLQGFWNATIYIATSLPACHALYVRLTSKAEPRMADDDDDEEKPNCLSQATTRTDSVTPKL